MQWVTPAADAVFATAWAGAVVTSGWMRHYWSWGDEGFLPDEDLSPLTRTQAIGRLIAPYLKTTSVEAYSVLVHHLPAVLATTLAGTTGYFTKRALVADRRDVGAQLRWHRLGMEGRERELTLRVAADRLRTAENVAFRVYGKVTGLLLRALRWMVRHPRTTIVSLLVLGSGAWFLGPYIGGLAPLLGGLSTLATGMLDLVQRLVQAVLAVPYLGAALQSPLFLYALAAFQNPWLATFLPLLVHGAAATGWLGRGLPLGVTDAATVGLVPLVVLLRQAVGPDAGPVIRDLRLTPLPTRDFSWDLLTLADDGPLPPPLMLAGYRGGLWDRYNQQPRELTEAATADGWTWVVLWHLVDALLRQIVRTDLAPESLARLLVIPVNNLRGGETERGTLPVTAAQLGLRLDTAPTEGTHLFEIVSTTTTVARAHGLDSEYTRLARWLVLGNHMAAATFVNAEWGEVAREFTYVGLDADPAFQAARAALLRRRLPTAQETVVIVLRGPVVGATFDLAARDEVVLPLARHYGWLVIDASRGQQRFYQNDPQRPPSFGRRGNAGPAPDVGRGGGGAGRGRGGRGRGRGRGAVPQ